MAGPGTALLNQLGLAQESSYNTPVTVTRFHGIDEPGSMKLEQDWAEGESLMAGAQMPLIGHKVQTTRHAAGGYSMDVLTKGFGLWFRNLIGSPVTAPTLVSGSAYRAYHQLGSFDGLSLTVQEGKTQPDGTVKPFTYSGTKVTGWELSSEQGGQLKLSVDLFAADEKVTSPALATATYLTGTELFTHTQLVAKIGGTASTASGAVSISGGTPIAAVLKSVSVKGTNPWQDDRYGTGQTVQDPRQNDFTEVTVDLDMEFASQAEFYDVFRAGTTVPLQLTWTQTTAISGAVFPTVDVIVSATKIMDNPVPGDGKGVMRQTVTLKAGRDGTNNPFQLTYISADTTL